MSLLSGGATGIIGTFLGRFMGYFESRQNHRQTMEKMALTNDQEIKLLDLQAKLHADESERELAIAESKAAADLRVASYGHDTGTGQGSQWVTNTLRLVRPGLTLLLVLAVIVVSFSTQDGSEDTRTQIIQAIVYLATSAVTWWFGDRAPSIKNRK